LDYLFTAKAQSAQRKFKAKCLANSVQCERMRRDASIEESLTGNIQRLIFFASFAPLR
jgi:hypothetical protein